jgi:signal transduction histidine kinase/ligand-binding sensor domain-containing protein
MQRRKGITFSKPVSPNSPVIGCLGPGCEGRTMRKVFRKFGWLVCSTLILGVVPEASGAAPEPIVRQGTGFHHTAWNGLGAVFDLKQSSEGYLWLTTSKGVLRFDGVRFQSVEDVTRGAVHDNEIDSVFLSSSGGVWLTTQGAGLLFWKDGRLTTFPDRRCTPTRKQGKIIEDQDGSLWVQASANLFRLRGSVCEQAGADQGYPGGFAAGILMDSDGTLWIKQRTGPLLYLPRGQSKFQVSQYGEGTSTSYGKRTSTSYAFLHEAPDGSIWLSDDDGLRRVASKLSAAATSAPAKGHPGNAQFGDFTFASDGSLWAVTGKGVRRFDHVDRWPTPIAVEAAPGESFTPEQGLSSDAVWKVLIDREGAWVATNSGLDRLRRAALSAIGFPHAQEHEFSVAGGDHGSVWTGNSNLPLTHVAADGTITSIPGTRQTLSLRRDHNGTIWSAGAGDSYLWHSSAGGFVPLHYPEEKLNSVVFAAVDRNNDPWITTTGGRAYHLSGGAWSDQTEALGKRPGVMGAMVDDQAGNVWFAFSNKVVEWDGSTYHRFSFPDGQRGVSENTMSVRGDHVWLGGAGGVQLFTQGAFYLMRWKDRGLPGRVSGIVETETGDLWVNGFSGISHVSAADLKKWISDPGYAVSAEHLDELDGLPGLSGETTPEPSVVEGPDGRLWFATTRGIAWLDPAVLETNRDRVPPTVVISAVVSNGKTYADSNAFTLPAHTENLEIEYAALSLAIPERVLFRYKLDGVDNEWQEVGTRRQAFYTKLRPGNYKFRVIACNNDGVWNETGATIDLSIAPAFYQTIWFQAVCWASGAGLLWCFYLLRLKQATAQIHGRLEARLAERSRIARELHDTLLQSFQGLMLRFQVVDDLLPPGKAKEELERALSRADRAIAEGRNAVSDLRSSATTTDDLAQAVRALGDELATEDAAAFRLVVEGPTRDMHPIIRDELYRIAREALRNAFSHARAHDIEVELIYAEAFFRMRIRDDGEGISPATLEEGRPGHFGLPGMRERANQIGAKLTIWSGGGTGTEIELSIAGSIAYGTSPGRSRLRLFGRNVG